MTYNFDAVIDRTETHSMKWDPTSLKEQFNAEDLLPLWVADMDFKAPQPVIDALTQRATHGIYGYTHRTEAYHQAVTGWMKRRHDWDISQEWVLFTPGIVPAINFLIQSLCRPGDGIIVQPPVYYPFFTAIKNNGCHLVLNPLVYDKNQYLMNFNDLKRKAEDPRNTLLLLCSPHNPVGRVWNREELTELGKICTENNVTIVSDEIHSDLVFEGFKHTPLASISNDFSNNCISCTAPSKTFNLAGLQTSNLIISNPEIRRKVTRTIEQHHLGLSNCFGTVGLIAAYTHGEPWLEQLLDYLKKNVETLEHFLKERLPEIKLIKPEGTYLAWLDCHSIESDPIALERVMQKKAQLALDEGYIFGEEGHGFERINFACPKSILEKALKAMEKAFHGK
ncbi:MAG: pyridoxal phosphate-dependent aminotransferase [Desulfobacterales bacterium]|nr:pyridoxal phosphate-dependent aminotransferase [Desulfobacterales bacterium]